MTEETVVEKKDDYKHTIFKSSYHLGEHLLSLFVNYGRIGNTFSFVIKKGKWNTIYNLTEAERDSFLKNCLKPLSPDERAKILKELE